MAIPRYEFFNRETDIYLNLPSKTIKFTKEYHIFDNLTPSTAPRYFQSEELPVHGYQSCYPEDLRLYPQDYYDWVSICLFIFYLLCFIYFQTTILPVLLKLIIVINANNVTTHMILSQHTDGS